MSESNSNRWWENYLVRYLMPSVAGMAIVSWLTSWAGQDLAKLLLVPKSLAELDSASLILLFLYGNLFCYVASYPVLGFHVTRVVDFENGRWTAGWHDGYVASGVLALLTLTLSLLVTPSNRAWGAFTLVVAFAVIQIMRFKKGFAPQVVGTHLKLPANRLYAYAYRLARRRALLEEAGSSVKPRPQGANKNLEDERQRKIGWRREFVDSYRHLREHGNSGFIFQLELILAGLCYCVLRPNSSSLEQLSTVAILFAIWAAPAAVVHLMGQHLERRFSLFDADILDAVANDEDALDQSD